MDAVPTYSQIESQFLGLIEKKPLPVADLLTLIHTCAVTENSSKAEEWTSMLVQELIETADFTGLYQVVKDRTESLAATLKAAGIRDALKKASKDRLVTALIDTAGFGDKPLAESFRSLDLLLALKPGTLVIDPAWGLGTVKRLDDFYKRITIDFTGKPNHAMTFTAACQTLERAPHDHLLTLRHNDPAGIAKMAAEQAGELVKKALRSFGNMPVTKIEDLLTRQGFVAAANWKSFWESARKTLKNDPLIILPAKRAESIQLLAEAETYGDEWFDKLAVTKDPLKILDAITDLEAVNRIAGLEDSRRGVLEDRLCFAIKGAYNTDAALYARLAAIVNQLGFLTPPAEQLRAHLWDKNRYIEAAENLPVRDVASMVTFLLAEGSHASAHMLEALPKMPFGLLNEVLTTLKETPEAEEACRHLLAQPKAPPTLVNWIFRFRKEVNWPSLPPLIELLNHAIVLVEGKLSGEALRMQNNLKLLFEQPKWLDAIFEELDTVQRQLFFERIQASPAWDPSTHRSLLGRMLKLDPALAERKKTLAPQAGSVVHWTSWRSLAERQLQYKRLVEEELPKNSHDIATARSYGDLRENFEYQAAKDLQRQLLQRQAEMQLELKQVKGTDFADIPCDKVGPGTTVSLRMADGSCRTYTILGEWDRDEHLNIISCKTRLALNIEGKTVGEPAPIPSPAGDEMARIEAILPLDETIRAWIRFQPEETV
ncbi:MAG TPA: GreA/GreB family elongation factor [Kiritimatiellia bacterium]|nr:GreA/GreB family elongation factor [Kiritimatiellia bacterium]HPS07343.1 GreA/GreB family elongation factor [Kiritimatiellia bacterium]